MPQNECLSAVLTAWRTAFVSGIEKVRQWYLRSPRAIPITLVVVVCISLLNGGITVHNVQAIVTNERTVTQTQSTLTQIQTLMATLNDAETGQRGYIITGKSNYLQPYSQAIVQIQPQYRALMLAVSDDSLEQRRLRELQPLITDKLAELAQTITLKNNGQNDAALQLITSDIGQQKMTQIRAILEMMIQTENNQLTYQSQEAQSTSRGAVWGIVAASLEVILLLSAFFALLRWMLNRNAEDIDVREALLVSEQKARLAAEEANLAREAFLSVASHELKTPITTIQGNSQLLQRQLRKVDGISERTLQILDAIPRQTKRLRLLIESMLDISRIEQGQLTLNCLPVDLVDLAQRITDEVATSNQSHTFQFIATTATAMINGDSLRLEQVCYNLLQNAVKYSPDGGDIIVAVSRHDDIAELAIQDHGLGIAQDDLAHIFQRFYRVQRGDTYVIEGMGVGLYVTHEIIVQHGGMGAILCYTALIG